MVDARPPIGRSTLSDSRTIGDRPADDEVQRGAFQPRRLTIAPAAVGCKRLILIQPSPCSYSRE
jgi:hypothetical protein